MGEICSLRPVVVLCVVCASSFSFLLGYDIGIMSGAKRLVSKASETPWAARTPPCVRARAPRRRVTAPPARIPPRRR